MNFDKLNELVSIPKKTDVSKSIRKEFKTEISALLKEEGFSENTEKYLWAGFSFCGAEPLFDYLFAHSKDEQVKVLDAMFRTSTFVKNEKSNAFKMCISLLVYELNFDSKNYEIIERLVRACTWKYRRKDGSISKDNTKIVEKYFVTVLSSKVSFPQWEALSLKENVVKEFCSYMLSVCQEINNSKLELQLQGIVEWLNSFSSDKKEGTNKVLTAAPATECNDEPANVESSEEKNKPNKESEGHVSTSNNTSGASLFAMAAQLKEISALIFAAAEENTKIKRSYVAVKTEKEELQQKVKELELAVAEQEKALKQLQSDCLTKDNEIEGQKAEIEKLKTVISVYSEDKQSSMDGQLNAIASKLKAEYVEFNDALEYDMTVEIGEMLREQLGRIFKILSKAGINMVGR